MPELFSPRDTGEESIPMNIYVRHIVDFLYPPRCLACDANISGESGDLCDVCAHSLRRNHAARRAAACPRCAQRRAGDDCACAREWLTPVDRIYSFFDFDDTVRAIAHQMKYGGMKRCAYRMGRFCASLLPANHDDDAAAGVVMPVPQHWFRRMKRGYNQSDHFARGLMDGGAFSEAARYWNAALVRRRHTRTQTRLDSERRRDNMKEAFVVSARARNVLTGVSATLIDDVVTTGATVAACAEALRSADVATVRVISMARA